MSSNTGTNEYFIGLEKLEEGKYLTYYSSGASERASYLAEMAEKGYSFLQEFFQTDFEMPLMVLNKEDWEKRSEFPYGAIFSGNNCVHFPANTNNPFLDTVQPIYESSPKHLQQKLIQIVGEKHPSKNGFNIFFDCKIVHELTHVFLKNQNILFGLHWFTEFFCDYANYAFLKRYEADYRDLLDLHEFMPSIMYTGGLSHAKYTRSEDFDRLYTGVGWLNLLWFYGRNMLGVLELYKVHGEGFIADVVNAYIPSNEVLVERLRSVNNTLGPWFKDWLTKNP